MGQHGHDPKKHDTNTTRARHHSASAGTRHGLYSAWAAGPARGTSTGTARLMGRHDAGPITLTEMAQFANLGIKSNHFSFPQATAPIAILQPPPPLVTLVPSLPQPPDASILFSAPLSRPLAPRRRPAAAPPSRIALPARCRASLSRRTRPPPSPPVLASLASGHRRRSHAGRRRRRPGVPNGTARHAGALAGPCLGRDGGTAALRGTARRSRRAPACPCPCGPVGHLYSCRLPGCVKVQDFSPTD